MDIREALAILEIKEPEAFPGKRGIPGGRKVTQLQSRVDRVTNLITQTQKTLSDVKSLSRDNRKAANFIRKTEDGLEKAEAMMQGVRAELGLGR